jgi:hypothetical protein
MGRGRDRTAPGYATRLLFGAAAALGRLQPADLAAVRAAPVAQRSAARLASVHAHLVLHAAAGAPLDDARHPSGHRGCGAIKGRSSVDWVGGRRCIASILIARQRGNPASWRRSDRDPAMDVRGLADAGRAGRLRSAGAPPPGPLPARSSRRGGDRPRTTRHQFRTPALPHSRTPARAYARAGLAQTPSAAYVVGPSEAPFQGHRTAPAG